VRLQFREAGLLIEVADDGRLKADRHAVNPCGSGTGIAGMTERAGALGGTLEAGPGPGGGFLVRAWLPLDGSREERPGHDESDRNTADRNGADGLAENPPPQNDTPGHSGPGQNGARR
jgi:hypothetical protein